MANILILSCVMWFYILLISIMQWFILFIN